MSNYQFREMKEEDAIGISKLVYDVYGYTKQSSMIRIYDPEYIIKMNRQKRIFSFVVMYGQNQIIGHLCLLKYDKDSYEIAYGMVNRNFRSYFIMKRLCDFILVKAEEIRAKEIFSYAVSAHEGGQKFLSQMNLVSTAILLGCYPETLVFKGFKNIKVNQRETFVYMGQLFYKSPNSFLYIPRHHAEIIKKIYNALDIKILFDYHLNDNRKSILDKCNKGDINIKTRVDEFRLTGEIRVIRYTKESLSDIERILTDFKEGYLKTILLYLPLISPLTALLCRQLEEELGFFFAGIIPRANRKDELCLQYINDQLLNLEKVGVYQPIAGDILSYITKHIPPNIKEKKPLQELKNKGIHRYDIDYLEKIINEDINRAKRYNYNISILLFRVKEKRGSTITLKRYERLIEDLAKIINKNTRTTDLSAHFNLTEILCLMPYTNSEHILLIKERIVEDIKRAELRMLLDKITISIGTATFPPCGKDFQEMLSYCLANIHPIL